MTKTLVETPEAKYVVFIPAQGQPELRESPEEVPYQMITEAVGGHIECVRSSYGDIWINDEGLLIDLPVNLPASLFAYGFSSASRNLRGDVLIADRRGPESIPFDRSTALDILNQAKSFMEAFN